MQPYEFAQKWRSRAHEVTEEQAYQEHFGDVASLVGGFVPGQAGAPEGLTYQAGVKKVGTADFGKADVFQPGHFIWEAKRAAKTDTARKKLLGEALQQATLYARDLDNPPLIVTTDFVELHVHTNFTGTAPKSFRLTLEDIEHDRQVEGSELTALQVLRAVFHDPGVLDPRLLRERITTEATGRVGAVARAMVKAGHPKDQVAHFLMRVIFAMFSEDVGLLEKGLLTKLLERAKKYPDKSQGYFAELFGAMSTGGEFWGNDIRYFNGGLFDDHSGLPITAEDADALLGAAKLDWAEVEPAIFGGLFESSLEKEVRGQRGAHFTAVPEIERIVEPVVMLDLHRQWEVARAEAQQRAEQAEVKAQAEEAKGHTRIAEDTRAAGRKESIAILHEFQKHLGDVKVLDAACGSGNFLYVTLKRLLDLEHEVRLTAFQYGAGDFDIPPLVHPRQMLGIEIEGFAAELASVTLWIGYFQWNRAHGGQWPTPVLERLDNIQHRDALLNEDGSEYEWPEADYIVGNPPFLGEKKQGPRLGLPYVQQLRATYAGRVPKSSDLVCYWFEKAREAIEQGRTRRAGLISTNSISQIGNRRVLERINETGAMFQAWPDLPWLQDGAAVRVAAISFDDGSEQEKAVGKLLHEGKKNEEGILTPVATINSNLSVGTNVTDAKKLPENANLCFQGVKLAGDFDIAEAVAREWMKQPNPGDIENSDVLRPLLNGDDLTGRRGDTWVIDFASMTEEEASQYLVPFAHVVEKVKPVREKNNRKSRRERYWQLGEVMPAMRRALAPLSRYLATSIVAKYRTFLWCDAKDLPSGRLVVVASDQDWMYGVLNSQIHVMWAQKAGSTLEDRPAYTSTTCFEPFPFPKWTPETQQAVADAAKFLEKARATLKADGLTITEMYNVLGEVIGSDSPAYTLKLAHDRLDAAVAAAYGWEWPLSESDTLARLLALNLERSEK